MTMQERIKEELKAAMKAQMAERLNVIRMLKSAITNELVTLGKTPADELSDVEVIKVLKREAKKRKDSISQYESASRPELATEEAAELEIIEEFLPEQMTKEEIRTKVQDLLDNAPIDTSNKGQLMGLVMRELGESADGTLVKEVIEELVK